MRVKLVLSSGPEPELIETEVDHETGRDSLKRAVRGLEEGAYPQGYGSFIWTRGVRALSVLLLRWAAWGRYTEDGAQTSPPRIKGKRGSLAARINDAVTKKPKWLSEVFGSDSTGNPQVDFIKRTNPDFNRGKNTQVEISIDHKRLPPLSVQVNVEDREVDDPEEITALANEIERSSAAKSKAKKSKRTDGADVGNQLGSTDVGEANDTLPVIGNPPPPPDLFFGRDKDLQKVREILTSVSTSEVSPGRQRVAIIRGWPGVGKSAVAAALAHDRDLLKSFSDGVLWVSLGQRPNLLLELSSWMRHLGVRSTAHATTVKEASIQLRLLLADRSVLLVVDDVWEIDQAEVFRVGGRRCGMLLTTRLPSIAEALSSDPDDAYLLPVLEEEDSLELLHALAPETRDYRSQARQLVRSLEGLPLALQVAGRLLRTEMRMGWGIDDLLKELRDETVILETNAPSDCVDLVSQTTPTVAALLRRSTNRLKPALRDYFASLGPFAPKPATFDL